MEYSNEKERLKRARPDLSEWVVVDDWPRPVPVTAGEIDVFASCFGNVVDELFPDTACSLLAKTRQAAAKRKSDIRTQRS